MRFRPLADRVHVKRIDAKEEPHGGIIIPDTAKEKPEKAELVALGDGGLAVLRTLEERARRVILNTDINERR